MLSRLGKKWFTPYWNRAETIKAKRQLKKPVFFAPINCAANFSGNTSRTTIIIKLINASISGSFFYLTKESILIDFLTLF